MFFSLVLTAEVIVYQISSVVPTRSRSLQEYSALDSDQEQVLAVRVSDLVEAQDGLDALVQEVGLPEQTAAVKRHQLLVEVHGEDVEVRLPLRRLSLPQSHGAQGASFRRTGREVKRSAAQVSPS